MERRAFLYGSLCAGLAAPSPAGAEPARKVYRVGLLGLAAPSPAPPFLEHFRQGLRDLGWVEDGDIVVEPRWAAGSLRRLTDLAADLVRSGVDVIVSEGTPGAHAARYVTRTIPIVMVAAADPVGSGLVRSLARPGGNVTGLSLMAPEQGGKRLELLRETVAGLTRVGVLWNPYTLYPWQVVEDIERVAPRLGVTVERLELRFRDDLDRAFEEALLRRVGALLTVEDPFTLTHRERIVDFAAQGRLPAIYGSREFAEAGGLMAYGPDLRALFRRAARYVDRILKGAGPADLAVEGPTSFELILNLKAARTLGIAFPPALLRRADQIIE